MTDPASGLQLPVDLEPGAFVQDDTSGHWSVKGESAWAPDKLVDRFPGPSLFSRPGWNVMYLAGVLAARRELRISGMKHQKASLATLAGYLRLPLVVGDGGKAPGTLHFITDTGDVTVADFSGYGQEFADVRDAYFARGLEAALAQGASRFAKNGNPTCHPWPAVPTTPCFVSRSGKGSTRAAT